MKRLAVDATLRAAAPYQRGRRQRAEDAAAAGTGRTRKVYVEKVRPGGGRGGGTPFPAAGRLLGAAPEVGVAGEPSFSAGGGCPRM